MAEAPSNARTTANVLSRVAERMYWLGRYLERADSTGRLIEVNANLLMDLPIRLPLGWQALIRITGAEPLFRELYGTNDDAREADACRFLAADGRNPSSIVNSLAMARENARNVRETMPRITFEYINELSLFARSELPRATSRVRRSEALAGISRRIQQLEGFLSQNMLHDANWELMRLGNYIERADMTTRIVDVRTTDLFAAHHDLEPFEQVQWRSILRSAYAMQSYNAAVREPVSAPRALAFLFEDPRLPRSYLRCLQAVQRSLLALPRHEQALAACQQAMRALAATNVAGLGKAGAAPDLHRFIDDCQVQLGNLHFAIMETYFDFRSSQLGAPSQLGAANSSETA